MVGCSLGRWRELFSIGQVLRKTYDERSLTPTRELTLPMLGTSVLAIVAANLMLLILTRSGRQLVLSTILCFSL